MVVECGLLGGGRGVVVGVGKKAESVENDG